MRELLLQQTKPQLSPEAQKLLAQLKDIHEPVPIGWWPPAPGWWLLGLLLLGLLAVCGRWLWQQRRNRKANRYRREGVRLLREVDCARPDALAEINTLLKRVAVKSYGRRNCGNLTGRQWLAFLRATAPIEMPAQAEDALLHQLYRADLRNESDARALRDYAIDWAEQHNTEWPAPPAESAETEVARV